MLIETSQLTFMIYLLCYWRTHGNGYNIAASVH